jgi:hypothetical protein
MSTIRNGLALALLLGASACYQESAYAQGAPTAPQDPQTLQGPPGGGMDPGYGYPQYQAPQQDPNAQGPGYAPDVPQTAVDPNAIPPEAQDGQDAQAPEQADPNYGTEAVDDATIDATLDGYGSWVDDDDYGRIWVPSATVVGADFTPYESDGSWDYSDSGWMFDTDYSWGWLPFHYGRWGWFDGYWGWVPGYQWGASWCDWRYGGGYVGWRPMAPEYRAGRNWQVRDHRHEAHVMDSQWRFAGEHELNSRHIAAHEFKNPAEGLRVTQLMRPPAPTGIRPMHSAALMQAHMPPQHALRQTVARFGAGVGGQPMHTNGYAPQRGYQAPQYRAPAFQTYRAPQNAYRAPAYQQYRAPQNAYRAPAYQQPYRAPQYQQPYRAPQYQQPYRAPAYQQYRAPQNAYRPPMNTYRPPTNTYRPPAPAYRPSYSAPSHSYSAPSHSYSAPSHSYSAPSHSFGGGGGGGFHSSGGGGGHHR